VTVCHCGLGFDVYRDQERVARVGCRRHRTDASPLIDRTAEARLRRAWSPEPLYGVSPVRPALTTEERAAAVDLRDAQRARRDVPPAVTSEDRLIAALHLPELVAEAA
jgi:hypothetical protein